MIVKIISTRGEEVEVELGPRTIRALISAECCDLVNLRGGKFMYVDDEGYQKHLPVNMKATKLYHAVCIPSTQHQILGDVVIVDKEEK